MGILGLSCLSLAVDLVDSLDSLLEVEGVSDSSSDDRELEGVGLPSSAGTWFCIR